MTAVRITGATRLYAIIGDPIAQVRSPEVLTGWLAAKGVNAAVIPMQVLPDRFDDTVTSLMRLGNMDGLLVTVPYKGRTLPFASRLGDTARCIGAVNALRREADGTWTGDMFDGAGFVRAAQRKGEAFEGRSIVLFGAGGAGSAIGFALATAKVASLAIIDPQGERARALAKTLAEAFPSCRVSAASGIPADANAIVNASTVGMRAEDGPPMPLGPLARDTLVGDVVVSEAPTAMIRHAMEQGCRYVTGKDMHAGQIDALMSFFLPHLFTQPASRATT